MRSRAQLSCSTLRHLGDVQAPKFGAVAKAAASGQVRDQFPGNRRRKG